MKKLLLLFVLISSTSFAQVIYGRVTYQENKKTVSEYIVQLVDSTGKIIKETKTDKNGIYGLDVSDMRGNLFLIATSKDFSYIKKTFKFPLWTPKEFSFALRTNKKGSNAVNVLKDLDCEK